MKRLWRRTISLDDMQRFHNQLREYKDSSLRMIHEYFTDDLIHIVKNLNTHALLVELQSRNVLDATKYCSSKEQNEDEFFANILLKEILDLGREAVTGFWECLYELQKNHPHPNLLVAVDEISKRGDVLVDQILLDEIGHSLTPELKEMQEKHKQHLMEKTKTLVEHRPPGCTLEEPEFPINDRYVDLIVVSSDEFRQRSQNELINIGEKHEECMRKTQTGLEYICPNRLFRWSCESQCVPHTVMLSGVPGIGKTTLMQKFLYDWVNGKLYQRFAFVFFFRIRDLNKHPEVSLEEMILQQYPYLENQLKNILQDPEKLLFIFDGLDESSHQIDFTSPKPCTDPKLREDFGVIVASVVRQSHLKGCSVLMTSRPSKLASIDTSVFQRIAEIMGFLPRHRLVYFERFFGNNVMSEKAFHCVQENETLYTFCYIPSFCWIICTVISMCTRGRQTNADHFMESLPKTITQLFVTFISDILANHRRKKDDAPPAREMLKSMGRMAEHGVMNHIIVFDEHHLNSFSIRKDEHLFSCFLMESGQPPDVDYSFLHLTLQEFLAALVHFIDFNSKTLQELLEKVEAIKDGSADILIRFLCGLSDSPTISMLKSHVKNSTVPAKQVINWLRQKLTSQRSTQNKRELLNAFYCLHETRNRLLVSECMESHKVIDFSDVHLSPLDCSILSFILASCRDVESLNLCKCYIRDEGLRKIVPALHSIKCLSLGWNHLTDSSYPHLASGIRNTPILKRLVLSNNHLEGPHFHELMEALTKSNIEELDLGGNHLTDSSCPHLASGIRNTRTLKKLVLSYNHLEGPHFHELMAALTNSNIEELDLGWNHLTDSSCPHLASGIRNTRTLKRLVLSNNHLQGPHFHELMEALTKSNIEELDLRYNHLSEGTCPHLASGIKKNPTLRKLDLTGNNLEGPHLSDLMAALITSGMEEFRLGWNHLTDSSCSCLTSGIRNNATLKRVDLSGNNLEGPHLTELMAAVATSGIEELVLENNNLTHSSCTHLASAIGNDSNLRRLVLSYNHLEGPHLRELMAALNSSSIQELCLNNNHLSDTSCPYLASGIGNNPTLRRLDLSGNNLEGPHLSELMATLKTSRIEELVLRYNKLTNNSCSHLASGIRNSPTLKRLDLSFNNLEGPHFSDVMAALTTSKTEELNLENTCVTDSSCSHLANGIRNTPTLRRLNLAGNNLMSSSSLHLSELIKALQKSRLEELEISKHYTSEETKSQLSNLRPGLKVVW